MSKFTDYKRLGTPVNHCVLLRVDGWLESVRDYLLPAVCTLCGSSGVRARDLCPGCAEDLPVDKAACIRCGAPLPIPGICGRCQLHPPAFDRTAAAFPYLAPVDAMIKRLKFNGDLHLARLLGSLMADHLGAAGAVLPEVIVPVPLHRRRLRERGFNQALELARPLARRLGVPLDWRHVVRTRATDPQADLPAKLRSGNVKDAFAVAPGFDAQRVAIVDDVMTTGYTVNELAATLRRAGVADISVWVCARAVFGR